MPHLRSWPHPARRAAFLAFLFVWILAAVPAWAQDAAAKPIQLTVDLTAAQARVFHATLSIPASPGPLTLLYPKWIPGEHGPTGPISDLAGIKISAAGKTLAWQRDLADMFVFRVTVPAGADSVQVELDYLSPVSTGQFSAGPNATSKLAVLSWNTLLLYPQGQPAAAIRFSPALRLPKGWRYGTSLRIAAETDSEVRFSDTSLEMLVDSPVIAGEYFRNITLSSGSGPVHYLHMAGDSPSGIEMPEKLQAAYRQLVNEAYALFGARHFTSYHFLYALSDNVASFGLEHHESSDNRVPAKTLSDASLHLKAADLLPHEFVHSWNGKYRRPAGLSTPDYQATMTSDLLWVYEGLTQYLGEVLAARSGVITAEQSRERIARVAGYLDHQAGRAWRPLVDTAVTAQLLYGARSDGDSWRRSVDFYDEGTLVWLDADVTIRQQTQGRKSLDDFCRRFHGAPESGPMVKPYTLDEIVATLNEIAPYDWRGFFETRVYRVAPRAPLGGIENGGWKLVYNEQPNAMVRASEASDENADLRYSLGMTVKSTGVVADAAPGMPAARAGLGAGMKIIAVNSRPWSLENLREAVQASRGGAPPIELQLANGEYVFTTRVDYSGGERQPHLERDASKTDWLSEILKSRTARP